MKYKITKISDVNKRKESFKDSRIKNKDETNLSPTIQTLVKDEEVTFDALIKSEYEAIALYTSMLAKVNDETIKEVLNHILNEENEHIVELKKILVNQNKETTDDSKLKDISRNMKSFKKELTKSNIPFTLKGTEFVFNNKKEFNKAIDLLENGLSFEYGGYDYDDNHFIIEVAESY